MKLPFAEPQEYKPREHLGVDYTAFSPFERQILNHFSIMEQRVEFANRRAAWALVLSMLCRGGVGVLFAAAWPSLGPFIRKVLDWLRRFPRKMERASPKASPTPSRPRSNG